MVLTTIGLWLAFLELPTLGIVVNALGLPFIVNTMTKVSATWFGPKGRNIATTVLLIGYFLPQALEEFLD